ncbi:MAG: hypothetical protein ABI887_09465 [Burkholderiales bacterium]
MSWLRGLLARRLSLVRKGVNIHVVFAPTVPEVADPRPAPATGPVADELRQVIRELRQRLGRHALSRAVFVELAIVERELRRHGYAALGSLPVELLHPALEQLAAVVGPAPGELGTLRTKLLDAMLARESKTHDFGSNLALSVFNAPHKLEVVDAAASDFFHAEQEWARRTARPAATAVLPTLVDTPEGRPRQVV